MKKALLLCRHRSILNGREDTAALVRLLDEQAARLKLDMSHEYGLYENLLHVITPDAARIIDLEKMVDISSYDVVYHRRWNNKTAGSLACAIYLDARQVPYIDREAGEASSRSKLTQMWRLWAASLPVPATVSVGDNRGYTWVLKHLDELPFTFPMILKGARATRGESNFLVHSAAELAAHLEEHSSISFLLQEFIPNKGDYRVIVCGDDVRFVMQRIAAPGNHANNTSQGGTAKLVAADTLPKQVLDDCIKAARLFGRDFAGVDVTFHAKTGQHYFFEVNRAPQIESGKCIDEKAAVLTQYLHEVAISGQARAGKSSRKSEKPRRKS